MRIKPRRRCEVKCGVAQLAGYMTWRLRSGVRRPWRYARPRPVSGAYGGAIGVFLLANGFSFVVIWRQ